MDNIDFKIGTDKNGNPYRVPITRKALADFVAEANEIWHGAYDYSDSIYKDKLSPITIYCPKHDIHFTVGMAQNHVIKPGSKGKATGCPVCSYENQHGKQYGPEWRETLRLSPKQNRVGLIRQKHSRPIKTPEQIAAEKAKREAKAEARRREEQAYIDRWKAKNLKEAHFLEKLQRRYPDMYGTTLVDFKDRDKKVTLICPTHGEFSINARQLFGDSKHKAHGCWRCAGLIPPDERTPTMTADDFFQRMHQLYDATELDFMTSEFHGIKKKVTAYCRKHGAVTHYAEHWLDGKGCEYCNGKFYPPDFLQMARKAQGQEYTYRGVNKITSASSRVMVHCGNPNHKWHRMMVWLVLQGSKCRECAGRHQPLEQRCSDFIRRSEKKHKDLFDYSRVPSQYVNNDTPVEIRCLQHNYWFSVTPDTHLRKYGGCPICNLSKGEFTILLWLRDHHIRFEKEPIWHHNNERCLREYLKPDFWLPDHNLVIEYNGEQHYEEVAHFKKDKAGWTLADQQERDKTLRQLCHEKNIQLLEIPYTEFDKIGEILTNTLLRQKMKG